MAQKPDAVAEGLTALAALRKEDDLNRVSSGITKLLSAAPSYVVSRAAELAAERGIRDATSAGSARLLKLAQSSKSDDVGCAAALALVRMLVTLEAGFEAESAAIAAARHERWEAVYGGSVDVAVAVRGNATILLAAMGSKYALRAATEVLAEPDRPGPRERVSWRARADAAKALTMIGSDGAAAVLRFKLLTGDPEQAVLGDCLSGLLVIARDDAFPIVEKMLDDPATAEAALLALGGWRDPRVFDLMHARERRFLGSAAEELYLASVAMTRLPKAIDYLFDLYESDDRRLSKAALAALQPLQAFPQVAQRLSARKS